MESCPLKEDVNLLKNDEIILIDKGVMQNTGGSGEPFTVPGSKLKVALNKKENITIASRARMKRNSVRRINSCVSQSELCQSYTSNPQVIEKEFQTNSSEFSSGSSQNTTPIPIETQKMCITCRPSLPRGITCSITSTDKGTSLKVLPISTETRLETMDCDHSISRNVTTNGRVWRYADTSSKVSKRQSFLENITLTPVKDVNNALDSSKREDHKEKSKLVQKRPNMETFALCKNCGHCNRDVNKCEKCNTGNIGKKPSYENMKEGNVQKPPSSSAAAVAVAISISPNDKIIPKQLFYHFKQQHTESVKEGNSENLHNYSGKMFAVSAPPVPKQRPRIAKNKDVEPVCLTISSDEEENTDQPATLTAVEMPGASVVNSSQSQDTQRVDIGSSHVMEKENNTSQLVPEHLHHDHSINVVGSSFDDMADEDEMERDNEEEDDIEDEEDDDEDEEENDQFVDEEEEEMEENEHSLNIMEKECNITIMCRSIRIGSYKVHSQNSSYLHVNVNREGFSFNIPTVISGLDIVNIQLTARDIVTTLGHFGRCLPILFIYTNEGCGIHIRNRLHMNKSDGIYFDPGAVDEKQKRITFLIESLTDEHKVFLRHRFPGENLFQEIDQKTANEILVRSTPTKTLSTKCHQVMLQAPVSFACPQTPSQSPAVTAAVASPVNAAVITPIVKILIYPPPPQTGGIAITNEDLLCLNEGEFLNDVIIDFYLRYLVNEKFSEVDRRRTHVFSSFFYPRLTQKPTGKLSNEEEKPSLPVRRHGQVRTWTRHVDIFEKDFIIIPINQNAHWFLAIICFPGLIPEGSVVPSKVSPPPTPSIKQKSVNNVSSSNDSDCSQTTPTQHEHLCISKAEQACNTTGVFNTSGIDVSSVSTSCPSFEHEVAEPCDPEDPLSDVPDSSTHPNGSSQCKKMPCILIFDSLAGPTRWRIVNVLREYLDVEWKIKKSSKKTFDRSTMQGFLPKVPQQSNFSDCGLFLLQYVESFFKKPLPYFGSPLPELSEWFAAEDVAKKRDQLKLIISDLQKKQHPSGISSITICNSGIKESENKSTSCETVIIPLQTVHVQNR